MKPLGYLLLSLLCWLPCPVWSSPLKVAVAANFSPTLEKIADRYTTKTGHQIKISTASTGTIFAQIINGAPYDVFLSADVDRPLKLEQRNLTRLRLTYATGRLALWAPASSEALDAAWLARFNGRLAVANPALAPYGAAAAEVMQHFDVKPSRLIRGANIAQTFQFVDSGNVDAGFVAVSQLISLKSGDVGNYWVIPQDTHQPVEQQAVVMRSAPPIADHFARFLCSKAARGIIAADGYLPVNP